MKVTFKVNSNADVCGTSLKGYVTASYAKLVELFGEPEESDGYKVSGEWIFESESGDVVTLYDWKQTNLYDPDYPSVDEFRTQRNNIDFHIGGDSKIVAEQFKQWLVTQL